jgi:hypothetical protein
MAKRAGRRSARRAGSKKSTRKRSGSAASARRRASGTKRGKTRSVKRARAPRAPKRAAKPRSVTAATTRTPRLDRVRRTLDDATVPTPPSSLNLDRHGSAARTGRAELKQALAERHETTPAITAGDVDANWEQAYFTGDEAPGGDNPTPDQDVVEEIGRAVGLEYNDTEELKSTDKVVKRDKHRWELDPASAEDYKERK